MKVLIANKFWYRRGGDCVYALGLEALLKSRGHEVAVFAMRHPENLPSEWSAYWPSEVEFRLGPAMFSTAARTFGLGEVVRKFNALLDDFRPDVVHLNNVHTQLSPVLAVLAHGRGIRVVWTLHDYKLLCPRYDCLRRGEQVCEECFKSKFPVLRNRCMKNSLPASALAWMEALKWDVRRLSSVVDTFICPSGFMRSKMLQGGFPAEKLVTLCNFIDTSALGEVRTSREEYCCYVGRLSEEKGVGTLVGAAARLPHRRFVIVGDGPMRSSLEAAAGPNVEFVGRKDWTGVKEIVGGARFSVIPSQWYENNPLSVIEAQSLGTPVLGARIGGIPELISCSDASAGCAYETDTSGDSVLDGCTFTSGDVDDLVAKLAQMFDTVFDHAAIAASARSRYGSGRYYDALLALYACPVCLPWT